ncbi:ATP-dependent Clp protease proteolytic subunit [Spirosoma arcticum]
MAKIANVQIYGEILPEGYIWDDEGTSLYRVRKQIEAAGEYDSITLNIFSPGGYCLEGWAIVDYLMSLGKPVNTLAYGQCASFGTVFHNMGVVREVSPHCDYVIHRPWDFMIGNDLQIDKANAGLRKENTKLFEHYAKSTGKTVDELAALIQEEDLKLSPQETVDHGFSTAIYQPGAAANVDIDKLPRRKPSYLMSLKDRKPNPNAPNEFQLNKKTTMAEEKKSLFAAIRSFLAFADGEETKALDVPLKDGRKLVTDSTGDVPVIGDKATLDGTPAPDGDYITDKDVVITVKDGEITNVVEPAATTTDSVPPVVPAESATVAALKADNVKLTAQLKEVTDRQTEMERRLKPVLAAMVSQDPQTQSNVQPATRNTESTTDRDEMLKAHVAKFAKKPAQTAA